MDLLNKIQDCFWRRKMERDLPPIIFNQGVGLYKFGIKMDDPEADAKFLNWVYARVKMARKPSGSTTLWLHVFPLVPEDAPKDGQSWRQLDDLSMIFRWEDYNGKKAEIQQLLVKSRGQGASAIGAVMINTGDALLELMNQSRHP